MARKRRLTKDQFDALLDILGRVENELPSRFITISEDGEEESYEIEDFEGIEVSTIEVAIDGAISEYQKAKIFPRKKKGEFSLSGLFEFFLGEHEVVDLVVELETALSGYRDLIRENDIETASELITEICHGLEKEIRNADLKH
jgi:hypothetical protein